MNKIKLTTTRLFVVAFLLCGLMIIQTPAAPGDLDPSFGNGGSVSSAGFYGNAIAIQTDGKIIAAGKIGNFFGLERYTTDGSLDATFGTGGRVTTNFNGTYASSVPIQSDGKIVAAGGSGSGTNYDFTVVRYNIDGSLDLTFSTAGKVATQISNNYDSANSAAIQSDGKIIAAGNFDPPSGGSARFAMVRYQGRAESGLTVTRSDDRNNGVCVPGDCSLREAVGAANASGSDDTINFSSGLTRITLTNEIVINNAGTLAINGLGANILTIDGGAGTNRIFYIDRTNVAISGVTLTGGNGTGAFFSGEGGAILDSFSVLTLDGVHVTGNSSSSVGGGLYSREGRCLIINSTISGNTAGTSGGGFGRIYFSSSSSMTGMTVVNSTISSNTALYNGGGIYTTSDTTLRNVTITHNAAQRGGGIFLVGDEDLPGSSRVNFGNTIVAGNNAANGIGPEISFIYGSIISAGGNLFGDSPGDSPTSINYQPTDIRDTNPSLGALQNNGGTTPTHALLAGSPIIDKGRNALVSPIAPAFDQRGTGFARFRDGNGDGTPIVDIGAFEVQLGATAARPAPFDFDGDGRSDISVFRPSDRVWYLNQSTAGFSATQFGFSTDKLTSADYDGDGKTDISVFRDGTWYWLNSSNGNFNSVQFGLANDISIPSDFTGDGRAELSVYRNGTWWTFNLANNQVNTVQFGISTDKPVVADYDGDGRADQAVYRNGEWHQHRSSQGYAVVNFGLSTDKPVIGDYDGDGRADQAVYRDGTWYLLQSTNGFTQVQFGIASDIPAPADYDGDGRTDAAVYRDGTWYLRQSTGGVSIQQFGLANDKPVQAAYLP